MFTSALSIELGGLLGSRQKQTELIAYLTKVNTDFLWTITYPVQS